MLQGYILRQALWPLLAAVASLGVIALLTQSISTLDLIIDQRQTLLVYLEITVLALPQLIALILPLAVVIATLYAVNRLQSDSELVVCSAAGMHRRSQAAPFMKLALLALIANLAINLWVQPTAFRHMRERLFEVRSDLAAKLVRPGQFRSPATGVTIYVREIDRGRLIDLLIEDARDEERVVTYMAKAGVFDEISGEPALIMYDGSIQTLEESNALSFLKFDSTPFMLTAVIDAPTNLFYKLSDRYLHELLFSDPYSIRDWRYQDKLIAEGHYRLASPLYNPALVLIALAILWSGEFARTGLGRRIAMAGAACLVVRLVGFAIESACADEAALNPLQYAWPLAASGAAVAVWVRSRSRAPRGDPPPEVAAALGLEPRPTAAE